MSDEMERVYGRVPSEIKAELDDESVNTSGLIRSLTEAYLLTGDAIEVGLERRLKDKERELDRKRMELTKLENDVDKLQREIDQIETKIEERRQQVPEEVIEFAAKIKNGNFPEDNLETDNPAIQNQAMNAGIGPEAFVREVQERL